MQKEIEKRAIAIIGAIWDGIDWSKYTPSIIRNIYPYFASRIRAAASTTADYPTCLESLAKKMNSDLTRTYHERQDPIAEKQILHTFREESNYLVSALRERIELRKSRKRGK